MSYARERQTHYEDACGQPQYQDIRKSKTEGYFGQGFISFDEGLFDSGDLLAENSDREFKGFKIKVAVRMTKLSNSWVHIAYTLQALYLLPLRTYIYKKRAWHYSLFDLCFYVTILSFIYLWIFPASRALFVACSCLSHGSLASAVITWRNSLVFHDTDKVTTLFIHVYLPFVFTVIRNFYPNTEERFLAFKKLPHLNLLHASVVVSTSPGNSSTGNSSSSTVAKKSNPANAPPRSLSPQ
ncbi:hypothetical protein D9758_001424 [Tetrapyrgos nigripes]|uniref:Glycerophosphocholine acyltransferase 1 n=1 Tax=Tetrapyrgos nigripes TaxID=182062 RepID=A0A8H5GSF1_9AGAR|nr:hypothetical protein D9758_001424 [Tetrapyrgos nigripes]